MTNNLYMKLFIFLICAIFTNLSCFGLEDNLKKAAVIAKHGSKFQAERLKIAAENISNAESTADNAANDPYRRKIIIPRNRYDKNLKTDIITTYKVDQDKSAFILRYNPAHPAADNAGYVKYPNVDPIIEKADASEARRSYEANLSIIEVSNSLIQKTIEAIK